MKNSSPRSGVYEIVRIETGQRYIGSTLDVIRRFGRHKLDLRKGIHECRYLQNAWNKYGESAFEFRVIEMCLPDSVMLCSIEQQYIDSNKGRLYNCCKLAEPFSREWHSTRRGKAHHRKISELMKERWENADAKTKQCVFCGKDFLTRSITVDKVFCSHTCLLNASKRDCKSYAKPGSTYLVKGDCEVCKKPFIYERFKPTKVCSKACAHVNRRRVTKDMAIEIITKIADGYSMTQLGKDLGLNTMTISNIVRRKTWGEVEIPKDVDDRLQDRLSIRHSQPMNARRLTNTQVREIKSCLANQARSQKDLASEFDVSPKTISQIHRGEIYSKVLPDRDQSSSTTKCGGA